MDNRKLILLTLIATALIEIGTVAMHWADVKKGRVDFANLYATARLFHEGRKLTYDPTEIRGVDVAANASTTAVQSEPPKPNVDHLHPPFEALLLYPIAWLPYLQAFSLWFVLNLVILWLVPYKLWPYISALHPDFHYIAILYGTALSVLICLVFGQDSILLLLLLTLSYVAMERGQFFRAGVFVALGLFKFQIILPLVCALILFRKWSVLKGFVSAFLVLAIATISVIGIHETVGYSVYIATYLMHISSSVSDRVITMPNLRGLVTLVAGSSASPQVLSILVLVLSIGVFVALWIRNSLSRVEARNDIVFSTCIVAASLVSYHYYVYNSVILLLPLLLTANHLLKAGSSRAREVTFCVAALSIYLMPAFTKLEIAMPATAVATLLLYGVLLYSDVEQRSQESSETAAASTEG